MDDDEVRTLLHELRGVLGDNHVRHDPDAMAAEATEETGRFGQAPLAVVAPGTVSEVIDLIGIARRRRVGLVPQGGRTSLVGGSVPAASGEIVVSMTRWDEISEIDEIHGDLVAGAGVTLAQIEDALAPTRWRYGVDFAARSSATVGGSMATNAGGPQVFRHGDTRRQIRGVSAVMGTGDHVDHLRGLRKDNTGYDLASLLCGSEGTLGIVCQVRLALIERTPFGCTAAIGLPALPAATALAWRIAQQVAEAEEVELASRGACELVVERRGGSLGVEGEWLVFVKIAADTEEGARGALERMGQLFDDDAHVVVAVDAAANRLMGLREGITDALSQFRPVHKYDVSLPSALLPESLAAIESRLAQADDGARLWVFGHVCDHNIHLNVTHSRLDSARIDELVLGSVIDVGGSISAEHGVGVAKSAFLVRNRDPGSVATMRAIKAALDPDGIMNPGVLLGV